MKIVLWINNKKDISPGLYIVLHYPLGGGRGKLIKGFGNGEANQGGKKRKKEKKTFGSTKSQKLISKTQSNSI